MPRAMHGPAARQVVVKRVTPTTAMEEVETLRRDVRALGSSILMLSQKMKYLVRNEKILGRNLIVLNKKVSSLAEQRAPEGIDVSQLGNISTELQALSDLARRNAEELAEVRSELDSVKDSYAKSSDVKEIKYVVDSINPLEFVTYKDVESMIDQKMGEGKSQKKK